MITITLAAPDVHLAEDIGRLRQARNRGVNADAYAGPCGHGGPRGEQLHIDGAGAQLAVAAWLGPAARERWLQRAYADTDSPQSQLVGGAAVRSTRYPGGCLLLHPRDPGDLPYVLVITAGRPAYAIAGWTYGWHGKDRRFWEQRGDGAACFYVPQAALAPV